MDTQALQDAIVVAEDAFAALLAIRRSNRDSMSPKDFRAYNESTRAEQVISVGTLKEGNSPGGVAPDG